MEMKFPKSFAKAKVSSCASGGFHRGVEGLVITKNNENQREKRVFLVGKTISVSVLTSLLVKRPCCSR